MYRITECLFQVHWGLIVLYISTFSLTTVIGAGAGMAMLHSASTEEDAHSVSVTVMQGIATGSLLYVVFFEVRGTGIQTNIGSCIFCCSGY